MPRLQADVDPPEAHTPKPFPPGRGFLQAGEEVQKPHHGLPGEVGPHELQEGKKGLGEGEGVPVREEDPAPKKPAPPEQGQDGLDVLPESLGGSLLEGAVLVEAAEGAAVPGASRGGL